MQDRPPAGRSVIRPILRSRLVALGGDWLAAVGAGGAADDAVEGEDEVGEVLEADFVGNLGHRTVGVIARLFSCE